MTKTTKRQALALENRKRLLDSARALFDELGYEKTFLRDVAAGAALSTGALFANFASKEDLWGQVYGAEYVPPEVKIDTIRAEVRAVIAEMRDRRINHGRNTSPTLEAWADRLEKALV